MAKLTNAGIHKALEETHGNISAAARALKVTRKAIQKRIDADPDLKQFLIDARETMVDDAETALAELVLEKDRWAIGYTLSYLGKDRGYVSKTILSGDKENPLHLEHSGTITTKEPSLLPADAAFAETLAKSAGSPQPDA